MEKTGKTVLIFDDDEDILGICTFILKSKGWKVHTFSDVKQVVERTAAVNPDIIFMDNWIPDTGGIVATQLLKNEPSYKKIPVVYFSANAEVEALSVKAGADSFLAKPFNMTELLRAADHAMTLAR